MNTRADIHRGSLNSLSLQPELANGETQRNGVPAPDLNLAYFKTEFSSLILPATDEWPTEFAIISAYATTGEVWSPKQNRAADRALWKEVVTRQCWRLRLTGYSPTSGHAEPGWAVEMPFEAACNLGLRFRQDAIYYVRDGKLFVSHCDHRRGLVPVGEFNAQSPCVTIALRYSEARVQIRTSPGAVFYRKVVGEEFEWSSFVLGGCSYGSRISPKDVAVRLWREILKALRPDGVRSQRDFFAYDGLVALGWTSVARHLKELERAFFGIAGRLQREEGRLDELQRRLREIRPDYRRYKDRDVEWWFQKLVAEHMAHPEFNPDDFNPIRFGWAAKCAVARIREYRSLAKEVGIMKRRVAALKRRGTKVRRKR